MKDKTTLQLCQRNLSRDCVSHFFILNQDSCQLPSAGVKRFVYAQVNSTDIYRTPCFALCVVYICQYASPVLRSFSSSPLVPGPMSESEKSKKHLQPFVTMSAFLTYSVCRL
ncbi:hypothetical protein VTL71DRAFT_8710 [Oculimacula yallundae]|uniref:Uncharacterized protein n=1 Tax=Oculimacula yallundae TaxID=86028 RepID=A0ABR4CYH1_9HELO